MLNLLPANVIHIFVLDKLFTRFVCLFHKKLFHNMKGMMKGGAKFGGKPGTKKMPKMAAGKKGASAKKGAKKPY